jgi:hypothetical protein
MTEQEAVLFLNEDDGVWELVTMDESDLSIVWETEADALRDLARDGWKIEGPFRMCPKNPALSKVWFIGYGLTRTVQ